MHAGAVTADALRLGRNDAPGARCRALRGVVRVWAPLECPSASVVPGPPFPAVERPVRPRGRSVCADLAARARPVRRWSRRVRARRPACRCDIRRSEELRPRTVAAGPPRGRGPSSRSGRRHPKVPPLGADRVDPHGPNDRRHVPLRRACHPSSRVQRPSRSTIDLSIDRPVDLGGPRTPGCRHGRQLAIVLRAGGPCGPPPLTGGSCTGPAASGRGLAVLVPDRQGARYAGRRDPVQTLGASHREVTGCPPSVPRMSPGIALLCAHPDLSSALWSSCGSDVDAPHGAPPGRAGARRRPRGSRLASRGGGG